MPPSPWTISVLTIPGRESHLQQLLASLDQIRGPRPAVQLVYNRPIRQDLPDVERRLRSWAGGRPVEVYFNNGDPTISGGRNFQLNLVKTPLVAFLDDDVSFEGDVLATAESSLRTRHAGLVGIPSVRGATGEPFKPRDDTPHVEEPGFRWCTVQGLFAAGFTNLLRDAGGFNPRRKFWGEWTELNLRLWRLGVPTGYVTDGARLRHWEDAPDSPTRNLEGRERHVLWGIICTALEYDAIDVTEATAAFWHLVEDRYLSYSFGESLSPRIVLQNTIALVPELSAAWGDISAFRERARAHPFPFAPFHPLTRIELDKVLPHARRLLHGHRVGIWPREGRLFQRVRSWLGRAMRRTS